MRREPPGRLSPTQVSALKNAKAPEPKRYADGGGLLLWIKPEEFGGGRSWIFRYGRNGRERMMGLGSLMVVSLKDARELAKDARLMLVKGIDPIDARNAARSSEKTAAARDITFNDAAAQYIAAQEAGWKSAKHAQQWTNTLATYAAPRLGTMRVREVETRDVLAVLEPIWTTKTETADRVKGRVESVLDWATTRGYREGLNPARWKGHLDTLLPAPSKVAKAGHHAALPYSEVREFVAALRAQAGLAARALELTILTCVRTSEMLNAQWSEFDLAARLWIVPAERMKIKNRPDHRVPLSPRAVEILASLPRIEGEAFVFPGARRGSPLSNMAMLAVLKRMSRSDLTTHGFRSTFRDWAAEMTSHPTEVAEMALAHAVGDKVEAAYRRGDLFEKRRALMDDWADACAPLARKRTRRAKG